MYIDLEEVLFLLLVFSTLIIQFLISESKWWKRFEQTNDNLILLFYVLMVLLFIYGVYSGVIHN